MKTRNLTGESLQNFRGYVYIDPLALFCILILAVFTSCTRDENSTRAEAYLLDAASHEKLYNVEVQLLEWHDNLFSAGQYSVSKGKSFTDQNGHLIVDYYANPKYDYSLKTSKDLYFVDDFPLPLPYKNVNLVKFPHGFIKTRIVNKSATIRWIDIYFTPFYNSQPLFKEGFENCQLFLKAFPDTTIVTTTIGGLINNLRILVNYTDYIPDAIVAKDSSFMTISHDTVNIKLILN